MKLDGKAKAIYEHMKKYILSSDQIIKMTDDEWMAHRVMSKIDADKIDLKYPEKQVKFK